MLKRHFHLIICSLLTLKKSTLKDVCGSIRRFYIHLSGMRLCMNYSHGIHKRIVCYYILIKYILP